MNTTDTTESYLLKESYELCKGSYAMEDMVDRLYNAEDNFEKTIKKLIEERKLVSEFENKSIEYFKENGNLPEWFIRYKLGQQLTYGYHLFYKEGDTVSSHLASSCGRDQGEYKEDKNYSVGYAGGWIYGTRRVCTYKGEIIDPGPFIETDSDESIADMTDYAWHSEPDGTKYFKLDHLRFDYDAEFDDSNAAIMDIFQNYYFDKKVIIYSHEGAIFVKIIDIWETYEERFSDDFECAVSGQTTTEGINIILSMIHKKVFPKKPQPKKLKKYKE